MSDHSSDNRDDELFAERVARALRAPERLDDGFEDALVDAIRADRPLRRRIAPRGRPLSAAWWSTPRTVRLSPIAGLAMAAGLAAVAATGTLRMTGSPSPAAAPLIADAVHDTVTLVRFVFVGRAKSVALVGDFNGWGNSATPLTAGSNGAWTASVPLPSGRHEYAFIVDGKKWTPDPFAPTSTDDFDTNSSVITVGN